MYARAFFGLSPPKTYGGFCTHISARRYVQLVHAQSTPNITLIIAFLVCTEREKSLQAFEIPKETTTQGALTHAPYEKKMARAVQN